MKRIKSGTTFSFDYVAYLVLASIIALLGLIENSPVTIVASMLVSPIMGPILACIFGCVVGDKRLRNRGIRNGFASLLLCILIGLLGGFMLIPIEVAYSDRTDKFITDEMTVRGAFYDILLDLFIAISSGAAAALSVLGENSSSMVGVAISASLLPPAVNAGFLWSMALYALADSGYNKLILRGNSNNDLFSSS